MNHLPWATDYLSASFNFYPFPTDPSFGLPQPILHTWIKDSTFISVLQILLVDVDYQNF
jgi:hypothetical protein